MSWANIRELIFHERKNLDPVLRPEFEEESPFETQYSALLSRYLKSKAEVDASIRCFALSLEWPGLCETGKFFLAARLDFGWEVASILNTFHGQHLVIPFPSPNVLNTPDVIEWLLIDIWPYGCGPFFQKQRWLSDQASQNRSLPSVAQPTCIA